MPNDKPNGPLAPKRDWPDRSSRPGRIRPRHLTPPAQAPASSTAPCGKTMASCRITRQYRSRKRQPLHHPLGPGRRAQLPEQGDSTKEWRKVRTCARDVDRCILSAAVIITTDMGYTSQVGTCPCLFCWSVPSPTASVNLDCCCYHGSGSNMPTAISGWLGLI